MVTAAASQRSAGQGRFSAIQAMPGTISASAMVSQPFSSARESASASEAIAPVANTTPACSLRAAPLSDCAVQRLKASVA